MEKNIYILLIFTILCMDGHAVDLEIIQEDYDLYKVKKDENLRQIAEKNIDRVTRNYKSVNDYMLDIKEWNPHVKNWKRIGGNQLYVTYPYSPHTAIRWSPSLLSYKTKAETAFLDKEYYKSSRILSDNLHMFTHVTVSQGAFLEKVEKSTINFDQNSPFTLGLGIAYQFESMPSYSNSTSVYYSQLNSAGVKTSLNNSTNEILTKDIPAEIGVNSYFQKNYNSFFSNIYTGIDYESFATFNLEELIAGKESELSLNQNQIMFITAGIGFKFSIFSPINIKISASKGVVSTGKFNGQKFLFYINQKIGKRFWYHILYKQHMLEGSTSELSIARIGFGVGMSLF